MPLTFAVRSSKSLSRARGIKHTQFMTLVNIFHRRVQLLDTSCMKLVVKPEGARRGTLYGPETERLVKLRTLQLTYI